jgi:hypothetical protein
VGRGQLGLGDIGSALHERNLSAAAHHVRLNLETLPCKPHGQR